MNEPSTARADLRARVVASNVPVNFRKSGSKLGPQTELARLSILLPVSCLQLDQVQHDRQLIVSCRYPSTREENKTNPNTEPKSPTLSILPAVASSRLHQAKLNVPLPTRLSIPTFAVRNMAIQQPVTFRFSKHSPVLTLFLLQEQDPPESNFDFRPHLKVDWFSRYRPEAVSHAR